MNFFSLSQRSKHLNYAHKQSENEKNRVLLFTPHCRSNAVFFYAELKLLRVPFRHQMARLAYWIRKT